MQNPKRSLYILFVFFITICIFFSGCGAEGDNAYSGEQAELAVGRIFDKIQEAYGDDYLPDTDMDAQTLQEEFALDLAQIDKYKAQVSGVSTHPDCLLVIKAKQGYGEEVEAQLNKAQQKQIEDAIVYPANSAKINASRVVRRGDYLAFILLGAINNDADMTEQQAAEFAAAQTQRGVDAFEDMFR